MEIDPLQNPTREVFGNIAPWMRMVFYVVVIGSIGSLVWQVWGHVRNWRKGAENGFETDWRLWLRRITVYAIAQKRVHRKSLGGVLHLFLFSGFVVLTIGTTLLAIADQGPINFHKGWYYLIYELAMDIFGVALCLGCLLAFYRRIFIKPPSLGHSARDWGLLSTLFLLGLTGFVLEAFRLNYTQVPDKIAQWSIIGYWIDSTFLDGFHVATIQSWHLWMWWIHAVLVALFFATLPVTRFLHVITGPINIAARPDRPMGALVPLDLEKVEKSGKIGVSVIPDFTRQQLLSLDACMECGRCEEACPATASGKPLSPKAVVVNLRNKMLVNGGEDEVLQEGPVLPETLWSCTMCQACVQECPVLIGHVDLISDLRRNLVGEGQIAGPPAKAMAGVSRQFNPYGRPSNERLAWAQGLNVPTVSQNSQFEYLVWVGCAASYDPRAQKAARALVQLLQDGGVNFAVLGNEERCTGDMARRLGDEFLFQERAQTNVETLNRHKVRKVITPCPHCFNTLKNEYPQFGGHYEVQHHSEVLADLNRTGKLKGNGGNASSITYHDPCYLARVNGIVNAPREVINSASGEKPNEMERNGKKTFCCGAGGGRMWMDEVPGQRVSNLRAQEVVKTGAKTLATGCPFCLNMMIDGISGVKGGENVQVMDIAELMLLSRKRQDPLTTTNS